MSRVTVEKVYKYVSTYLLRICRSRQYESMIEKAIETNECRKLDTESFNSWLENSIKYIPIVHSDVHNVKTTHSKISIFFFELVL